LLDTLGLLRHVQRSHGGTSSSVPAPACRWKPLR
jgi:hypothetical protein